MGNGKWRGRGMDNSKNEKRKIYVHNIEKEYTYRQIKPSC